MVTHSRDLSGRGTARAEDAIERTAQSHISPSILVYEDNQCFRYVHTLDTEARPKESTARESSIVCSSETFITKDH